MAELGYDYDNLTGSVLLQADSHSQEVDKDKKMLISKEQFWGNNVKKGLYYDYKSVNNKLGYTVSCEGWNDYRDTEKMNIDQTAAWINNNIFERNKNSLCVIQGYAGCGKTTFVQNILREVYEKNVYLNYYNFYIGYVRNASEELFIPSCILLKIITQITTYLQEEDGMEIYDKFAEIFKSDLSQLSPILETNFAPVFYSKNDASLYEQAKLIYQNRNSSNIEEYVKEFRVQFKRSYQAKIAQSGSQITNMLEILLFIDYILRCSVYLVRNRAEGANQIVVYDNLDIIENHQLIAEFIDTIRSVLSNYISFRKLFDEPLPVFKAMIIVRKITYASISRFVEVGSREMNRELIDVEFLDISNLYLPSNILKHKAKVLVEDIDEYVPSVLQKRDSIVNFLNEVLEIPDEIFLDIKFAELLNHNIRACTNMMEQIIKSPMYAKYFRGDFPVVQMKNKCKSSIWIHIICSVLKDKKVWDNLGYNLSSSEMCNNPTTLSRLILTFLCNRRLRSEHNRLEFATIEVSLKELIEALEKIPFGTFNKRENWNDDIKPVLENNYTKSDNHKKIIASISKMLQRNNSTEEIELWRRPIYHTQNAFSLSDINEVNRILFQQIEHFNDENPHITSFCITDEGYTFVEKIATHFEFYSVRYNNCITEPISCVLEADKLDRLIKRVFRQVEICTEKQVWLMEFYMNRNDVSKDKYLSEWFHPRTEGFKAQLHIVRTIYDHISYLDEYREYLFEVYKLESNIFEPLNYILVKWIGHYLELYRQHLFEKLKDTIEEYNNQIWLDLKYLYCLVFKDEKKKGFNFVTNKDFISINRKKSEMNIKKCQCAEYKISEEELLSKPMLFEWQN